MTMKIKFILMIFLLLFVFIFEIYGIEKLWVKDYYDPYNPKTEGSILSRIKNGWYPAGFEFDGLDFTMNWINKKISDKLDIPFKVTIGDFAIITIPDSEEGINKILPEKLGTKFIPIAISYYADDFFIFAIQPIEKRTLQSYVISHFHKTEENEIAVNLNNLLENGYIPVGFSYYLDYYIFLSIKIKEVKPSKDFYWGIDWIANQTINVDKYFNSLFKNRFYPSDYSESTELLGVLVLHR